MTEHGGRMRGVAAFALLTVLPIVLAGAGAVLGTLASIFPANAASLGAAAIGAAVLLGVLLVVKAVRDRRREATLRETRYDAARELLDRLAPALAQISELALVAREQQALRHEVLRRIAVAACGALVSLMPRTRDARAVVFELRPTDIHPLASFGRSDPPRTFAIDSPAGQEIAAFLASGSRTQGELNPDTSADVPPDYDGDDTRYRTFIRTPIGTDALSFGMLTIDAPSPGSLSEGDVRLAELVAAVLAGAFAVAASPG